MEGQFGVTKNSFSHEQICDKEDEHGRDTTCDIKCCTSVLEVMQNDS